MPKLMAGYPGPLYIDGITDDELLEKLAEARNNHGAILEKCREVRDTYNNDIVLPVPELGTEEAPAVPNLLSTGLDGHSQRIASTAPAVSFPAQDDGHTSIARHRAKMRRDVVYGWWDGSNLELLRYRMARHYSGYGATYLLIRPDSNLIAPRYIVKNPLNTYAIGTIDERLELDECIFTSRQNGRWIAQEYPGVQGQLRGLAGDKWVTEEFEIVEYVSCDEWVTVARLPEGSQPRHWTLGAPSLRCVRLDRIPNRIGVCPVIPGGRFGLDRVIGQFEQLTGMYVTQAELQALEIIAARRDVFPDVYLEGLPNQNPVVLKEANGIKGVMGKVMGGRIINLAHPPGYQTNTTIDRIERNARTTGRIPSEFGGESGTNIRTNARGNTVVSSTVDFGIQEAQVLFSAVFEKANKVAIEVDLAYYGKRKKTYYLGARNMKARTEDQYTPEDLWTTNRHKVHYSHPGSDTNQLTIAILQLVGASMMSKRTGMEMHPLIDDAEHEHDMFQAEQLESAMLASLTQQASSGAIPPADLARIAELVAQDRKELFEAIKQVQEEAQKRQATPAPADAPEAQPGLAQPGMGAEQPAIPEPPQGSRNLLSLLTSTRLPQMSLGAERGDVVNQTAGTQAFRG